jgi:hypothetical protein
MPTVKKNRSLLDTFAEAFHLQPDTLASVAPLLSQWEDVYQHLRTEADTYLKNTQQTAQQKNKYSLSLLDQLRQALSAQLQEEDLRRILADALFIRLVLHESELLSLQQVTVLQQLFKQLDTSDLLQLNKAEQERLQQLSQQISELLPSSHRLLFWQLQLHKMEHESMLPLSEKAIHQSAYLLQYLMKRQLGISLNDTGTQLLWINPLEHQWHESTLGFVEADLQEQTGKQQFTGLAISLLNFTFHYLSKQQSGISFESYYWLDPLNIRESGMQTQLFSGDSLLQAGISKVQQNSYKAILLDLRTEQHPYRYARKAYRQMEEQAGAEYLLDEKEGLRAGYKELLLHWAGEKSSSPAMLVLVVNRFVLTDFMQEPFRTYLHRHFPDIYVVDFKLGDDDESDGVAVIFLAAKSASHSRKPSVVHYTTFSYAMEGDTGTLDFENIDWKEIRAERQKQWIGLPESDFYDYYPLYAKGQSFFRQTATGTESLMPHWLTDTDPQRLKKKVKFLLKEYHKGLSSTTDSLNPKISWHPILKEMAAQGIPLDFNPDLVREVMIRPFVSTYLYAEEKLTARPLKAGKVMALSAATKETVATTLPVYKNLATQALLFPRQLQQKVNQVQENINAEVLQLFREFYRDRTKNLDNNFIVFPPESVTNTLDRIASVSRDLPVLRKYPEQINQLLEDARNFTSDVELLSPPYEKIEEFRLKVLRLERDAIERKVIYQRVKSYIEELKEQLSQLTAAYDQARKDHEAVSEEHLLYYLYAVLNHPQYHATYAPFLRWDFPRIPAYPHFRKWLSWGKSLFDLHSLNVALPEPDWKVEIAETTEKRYKKFSYHLDREEQRMEIRDVGVIIHISNIPQAGWEYTFEGLSPMEYFLDFLAKAPANEAILREKFGEKPLSDSQAVIKKLSRLCMISVRTMEIRKEMIQSDLR